MERRRTPFWANLLALLQVEVAVSSHIPGRSDCGSPGIPWNGHLTPDIELFNAGDEAVFQCNRGFVLDGHAHNRCRGNGVWKEDIPLCRRNLVFERPIKAEPGSTPAESLTKAVDGILETCATLRPTRSSVNVAVTIQFGVHVPTLKRLVISVAMSLDENTQGAQVPSLALKASKVGTRGRRNETMACSFHLQVNTSKTGNVQMEWRGTCNGVDDGTNVTSVTIECRDVSSLNMCEIQSYIDDEEATQCGTPDKQPRTEVTRYNDGVGDNATLRKVEYRCKYGLAHSEGDLIRHCRNGNWTGKAPTCAHPPSGSVRNASEVKFEPKEEGIPEHKVFLDAEVLTMATGAAFLVAFVSLVVAVIIYQRKLTRLRNRMASRVHILSPESGWPSPIKAQSIYVPRQPEEFGGGGGVAEQPVYEEVVYSDDEVVTPTTTVPESNSSDDYLMPVELPPREYLQLLE